MRTSHSASESLPPEIATSTRSVSSSIDSCSIARFTCSRKKCRKHVLAERAVVAAELDHRPAPCTACTSSRSPRRRRSPDGSRSASSAPTTSSRVRRSSPRMTRTASGIEVELPQEHLHALRPLERRPRAWGCGAGRAPSAASGELRAHGALVQDAPDDALLGRGRRRRRCRPRDRRSSAPVSGASAGMPRSARPRDHEVGHGRAFTDVRLDQDAGEPSVVRDGVRSPAGRRERCGCRGVRRTDGPTARRSGRRGRAAPATRAVAQDDPAKTKIPMRTSHDAERRLVDEVRSPDEQPSAGDERQQPERPSRRTRRAGRAVVRRRRRAGRRRAAGRARG